MAPPESESEEWASSFSAPAGTFIGVGVEVTVSVTASPEMVTILVLTTGAGVDSTIDPVYELLEEVVVSGAAEYEDEDVVGGGELELDVVIGVEDDCERMVSMVILSSALTQKHQQWHEVRVSKTPEVARPREFEQRPPVYRFRQACCVSATHGSCRWCRARSRWFR